MIADATLIPSSPTRIGYKASSERDHAQVITSHLLAIEQLEDVDEILMSCLTMSKDIAATTRHLTTLQTEKKRSYTFDCLRGIGHDVSLLGGLIDKRTIRLGSTQLGAAAEKTEKYLAGAKYDGLPKQSAIPGKSDTS